MTEILDKFSIFDRIFSIISCHRLVFTTANMIKTANPTISYAYSIFISNDIYRFVCPKDNPHPPFHPPSHHLFLSFSVDVFL